MNHLAEVKSQVKELITQGIDRALKYLVEVVDPSSPNYNSLTQLRARYSAYMSNIILGTISQDDMNLEYARLSHALIMLTEGLHESDLNRIAPNSNILPARRGELLYNIPAHMQEKREYRCVIRVAYLKEWLYEGWVADNDDTLRNIRVAEVMSVELTNIDDDEPFTIKSLHNTVQFLDEDDFTEWIFLVKPKYLGEFALLLRVSVIEVKNGREVKKDVVLEQHVVVANEAEEAATNFAKSGIEMDFSARPTPISLSKPSNSASPRGLRALALFFAFVIFGSGIAWAAMPLAEREWWLAKIMHTANQYERYANRFPASSHTETALFSKAELTDIPIDYLQYLQRYGNEGIFSHKARAALRRLEQQQFKIVFDQPSKESIEVFISSFPQSSRYPEIVQNIRNTHHPDSAELLKLLEAGMFEAIGQKEHPEISIKNFLTCFPVSNKLPELGPWVSERPWLKESLQQTLPEYLFEKLFPADPITPKSKYLPLGILDKYGKKKSLTTQQQYETSDKIPTMGKSIDTRLPVDNFENSSTESLDKIDTSISTLPIVQGNVIELTSGVKIDTPGQFIKTQNSTIENSDQLADTLSSPFIPQPRQSDLQDQTSYKDTTTTTVQADSSLLHDPFSDFDFVNYHFFADLCKVNTGGKDTLNKIIGGVWGLTTSTGKLLTPLAYDSIFKHSQDIILLRNSKGLHIFQRINRVINQIPYDEIGPLHNGWAKIRRFNKYGFVDQTGREVVAPNYDELEIFEFLNYKAKGSKNNKWGLIDHAGNMVISPMYDDISPFDSSYVRVKKMEHYDLIDSTGREKTGFIYDS